MGNPVVNVVESRRIYLLYVKLSMANLSAGVTYTFQIIAVNAAGTSLVGTATGTPFTAPGAPGVGTGGTAGASVGTSPKTAVITFIQGARNGNPITEY